MDAGSAAHRVHRYRVRCDWAGSTADGYDSYDRTHRASTPPAPVVALSADPAFGGDAGLLNPEQLVVMAASSCQLLSFLAAAARARVVVTDYVDDAEGVMPEDDLPMRLTAITLRPTITVGPGTDEKRVRHLVEVAHRQCFVANSLATPVEVVPTIDIARG